MIQCLLVTSDPQVRDTVKVGLEQMSAFQVDVADDRWAIETARAKRYQVVVSDTTLADGTDGLEVLRGAREALPSAELLLVVRDKGHARELAKDKQELGLYAFVTFPVDALEFFRTFARLVARLSTPATA